MNIKKLIQEEIDSFDWVIEESIQEDNVSEGFFSNMTPTEDHGQGYGSEFDWVKDVEGIHVGMCVDRTGKYVVTQIDGDVVWLTSPDTDRQVQYGVRKLKGLIGNGTMTLC